MGQPATRILITTVALATWLLAAGQLEADQPALAIVYLIPFAAPGAMIGIALSWLSHVFRPDGFTWQRGRTAAAFGALLLPPWLALLVAVTGMTIAGGVLIVVGGAWIVLLLGVGTAAGRWVADRLDHAAIRDRIGRVVRRSVRLRARRPERRVARRLTEMFGRGVLTREEVRQEESPPPSASRLPRSAPAPADRA